VLAGAVGAFIALLGANKTWQRARGVPTSGGVIARGIMAVVDRTDPSSVLVGIVALGVVALALGFLLDRPDEVRSSLAMISLWLSFHLQVLVHELGHWSLAHACGYRPYRLVGGAFAFATQGSRWRPQRNRDWLGLVGGAVLHEPPGYQQTWGRDVCVVAAGPAASALLLYVFVQGNALLHGVLPRVPLLQSFVQTNVGFGVMVLVVNLLPFRIFPGACETDGQQLWRLLRSR
jgi:hypothetical protein